MSNCACLYADVDGFCVLYSVKVVIARKPFQCCECRRKLPKGAKYELAKGMYEGIWFRDRTCLACVEVRKHFYCDDFTVGTLWEDMAEQIWSSGAFRFECLSGLSVEAREFVLTKWRRWKGLAQAEEAQNG